MTPFVPMAPSTAIPLFTWWNLETGAAYSPPDYTKAVIIKRSWKPFGYFYVVRWTDNIVKFGKASDLNARFRHEQSASPIPLKLLLYRKCSSPVVAYHLEQAMLHEFQHVNVSRFDLPSELCLLPKIAAGDLIALDALGGFINEYLRTRMGCEHYEPPYPFFCMSPASSTDLLIHAAENQCYWYPTNDLPRRPLSPLLRAQSERLAVAGQTPEVRAKLLEGLKARNASGEFFAKSKANLKKALLRSDVRAKRSAIMKDRHRKDPNLAHKMLAGKRRIASDHSKQFGLFL
jgi:hypothetical protein